MNCSLCGMEEAFNRHHLIPRTVHSNKWFKKNFTREEMNATVPVCGGCHGMVTALDPKELGRNHNTVEKLLEHPTVASYVAWKRRKK